MIVLALVIPALVAGALAAWRYRGSDWRRLTPAVAAMAAVLAGWSLVGGFGDDGAGWWVVLVAVPALAFLAVVRSRPAVAPADRWSGAGTQVHDVEVRRARTPSSAGAVARALGRAEARELARSPFFGAGVGFCVLFFVLFGIVFATDTPTWEGFVALAPWLAHPLVGLTVLACHRAVTRDLRDHSDELLDTCPTTPTTRTAGFLLAAPVPVLVLAVMFVALALAVFVNSDDIHGPVGLDSTVEVAASLLLGAGGVALGVALGRWARFALVPVIAVAAVAAATLGLNGVGGNDWKPVTLLSTAPTVEDLPPIFQDRPSWWHLLWISGLVVLVALVAVVRHRRDRPIAMASLAAVAVVVAAGVGATRPMPASSAEHIASLVAEPDEHHRCLDTDGPLAVCGFDYHRDLLDRVAERVAPVAAALPTRVAPLVLRQTYDGDLHDLAPEIRRLLSVKDLDRPAREIALGFGSELADVVDDPGFAVAYAALGIRPEADERGNPTVVAGQARGVVAIWLATRGLGAEDVARASTSANPDSPDPFERGSLQIIEPCAVPAVVWSGQDLAAARSVLALPDAEVGAVISRRWERWRDPTTDTDELLAALGLPDHGPYDRVYARPSDGGC